MKARRSHAAAGAEPAELSRITTICGRYKYRCPGLQLSIEADSKPVQSSNFDAHAPSPQHRRSSTAAVQAPPLSKHRRFLFKMVQIAPAAPSAAPSTDPYAGFYSARAVSTGGAIVPNGALYCEVIDNSTGAAFVESMPGKEYPRVSLNGSDKPGLKVPIQTQHINIRSEYTESKSISVRVSTKGASYMESSEAIPAPVSHAEFYKDMRKGHRIQMLTTIDGVSDVFSRGRYVESLQYNSLDSAVLCRIEEVEDETKKDGKRKEWVDHKILLTGGEETKKGEIVVELVHGTDLKARSTCAGEISKDFEDESAFRFGDEVKRYNTAWSWDRVKTIARIHFHYEVEGKKEKEAREELARKEKALKEQLEAEMKFKQEQFKRMLEKKNRAKVKALRKMMAVLSTEEIRAIAAGALEVPSVAGGIVDDSDDDDETVYECQDCGSEDCDEYECYDCGYPQDSDDESEKGSEVGSEDDKDEADNNESDSAHSSDGGWENIKKETISSPIEAPVALPAPAQTPAPVSRGWFFNRS
ncbi:hypothetical protein BJ508DRAFT_380574 [Ascobolus immersus RN42]|uniref:Uncharacterized protein n=1 Tax=Ascobolus immersus RN42 TaxID=1160509 RepID=A0A3N4HPN3_ASCIM|nr:hypothetical protein BJ508DRAFT_380574 [Ascobolus immersus RN42]